MAGIMALRLSLSFIGLPFFPLVYSPFHIDYINLFYYNTLQSSKDSQIGLPNKVFAKNIECTSINLMGKREKLLRRILSGQSDYNISFNELVSLLLSLGFKMRQEGSHKIFHCCPN